MTLSEVYNAFSELALDQPNIRTVILNDIYRLDTLKNVKYSVFGITPAYEHEEDEDYRYYNLHLYYIDRLIEDGSNDVDIQSIGFEVLSNIITAFLEQFEGKAELHEKTKYQTFYQKFVDECAGIYARVKISIPRDSYCEEIY